MSVKPIQSAIRVLDALEILARHQPLGVGELARQLGVDKSAAQRVLATLASSGWIRPRAEGLPQWELSTRIVAVASDAQAATGLAQLIRSLMVSLRDQIGETVICAVPDIDRIVITDVVECAQMVRVAPSIGFVVPAESSASGRALLAPMQRTERDQLCGIALEASIHKELDATARRGWSLSVAGDIADGSTSVGAPVLSKAGAPLAAIAISGISARMTRRVQKECGEMLVDSIAALNLP